MQQRPSLAAVANNGRQGLITPPLVQNTGFGAYTFFAVFCLLSLVWTYIFVPETCGRTLEQMDHVFKDSVTEEDDNRRKAIESELVAQSGELGSERVA